MSDFDSDAAIVHQVLAGHIDAYAVLVARYRDRLYRFAVRMLGNPSDAEEAVQDAFLRAFRALASCREPARFDGWLYRILVNRCRTRGARRQRYEATFVHDAAAVARSPATTDRPDGSGEWSRAVTHALAALPAEQREAFLLKYVEELSYPEIAALTGVGISALKMRVKRAAARLRELLQASEEPYVPAR